MDRGELDKIIERSTGGSAGAPLANRPRYDERPPHEDPRHGGQPRRRKREGFLSDLFDFD